jgi:ribose/xylose/arabinose/galactoside ABC-type transport system permease subunit
MRTSTRDTANGTPALSVTAPAGRSFGLDFRAAVTLAAGVLVLVAAALTSSGFFTVFNFNAIMSSCAVIGIIAVGETVIMLSGNAMSLSLATTSAVSAMVLIEAQQFGFLVALIIALAVGVITTAIQGYIIGRYNGNPIIVTLAAGSLLAGIAGILTDDNAVTQPPNDQVFNKLNGQLLGVPTVAYVFVGFSLLLALYLRYSVFGVRMYMMGDNKAAAKAAGLRTAVLTTQTFALAGLAAGLAGVLLATTNGQASLSVSGNDTLYALTAAIVGGTAVTGGRGSVVRTIFGAVIAGAISDWALLRGYGEGGQILVQGCLILIVILAFHFGRGAGSRAV